MSISLKLPRQQRRTWLRRPRPGPMRQWADGLSLDDYESAVTALARKLRDLNFSACPGRLRLRCLAPLHGLAAFLHETMTEGLTDQRLPLAEPVAGRTRLMAETWSRLAVGYLCALRDLKDRELAARDEAALGGLHALGRLLLTQYHLYVNEPAGTWRAIHHCSEQVTRRDATRAPATYRDGDAPDPETAYKQILVLAGTGPYRLRPTEQAALFNVLATWASQVQVRSLHGAEPKAPPMVFRPGEDEPPRQYPLDQMPDAPGLRCLDPRPLAGRAKRRLEALETGDNQPRLSGEHLESDTLRALLTAWSGTSVRQFPRSESSQEAGLALGLDAAWQALQDGDARSRIYQCRVANRSAAGFRAVLADSPAGVAQVGEVAAVRESQTCTVGLVRWLRLDDAGELHLGIESLSRQAHSLSLGNADAGRVPAILLEGNPAADTPDALLLPKFPFREDMVVSTADGSRRLRIGRMLETSRAMNVFRVYDAEQTG